MAKRKTERDLTKHVINAHVLAANVDADGMTAVVDGVTKNIIRARNLEDGYWLVGYVDEHREIKHEDSPGRTQEGNKEGWR